MKLIPNGNNKEKGGNMKNKPKVHEKIRAAMILKGYTQEQIAKTIGMGVSTFNLKINGTREFSISEGKIIANKLGTTLDGLFF